MEREDVRGESSSWQVPHFQKADTWKSELVQNGACDDAPWEACRSGIHKGLQLFSFEQPHLEKHILPPERSNLVPLSGHEGLKRGH